MGEQHEPKGAICTYSGIWITPLDPNPEHVSIYDIAHSTAQQCRFTGHTRVPYSVAQHSVHVSEVADPEDALWGLLHDATETYLSDFARPIKSQPGFGDAYREVEDRLMEAVAKRFGLPATMPASVKKADGLLLRAEQRDLMPDGNQGGDPAWEKTIEPWPWDIAERAFLMRYSELTGHMVIMPPVKSSPWPIRGWGFLKKKEANA